MKKHIIFSDFDGTICTSDTTVLLIDRCITTPRRKFLDSEILHGRRGFRDAVGEMWDNVKMTKKEAEEILKDMKVDPGFLQFIEFAQEKKIPVIILSSGLTWIVTLCIEKFLGSNAKAIQSIVANEMLITDEGDWKITWVDDSSHGHDKALSIRKIMSQYPDAEKPTTYYIGDGISDISAACECDYLFAKKGLDLEEWCLSKQQKHITWTTFRDVEQKMREVVN